MTKVYRLRDENGMLKTDVPERIALNVITNDNKGKWRTAKFTGGRTEQRFTIGSNTTIEITKAGETLRMYFWDGDEVCIDEK